jgi:hypothetical protein
MADYHTLHTTIHLNQPVSETISIDQMVEQTKKMILWYDLIVNIIAKERMISGVDITFFRHFDLAVCGCV